jgi:ankyrin repeat protein
MEVRMSLPERPSLEQLRRLARELKDEQSHPTLAAAQLALARSYGFSSWARLKRHVELVTLRRLITEGDPAPVRAMLDASPALAKARWSDGNTPLHLAAEENRADIVALLVERGAPLEGKFAGSAHSPLSWAITCWSFDAAHRLVELGSVPDLFCAAGLGLLDRVRSFWREDRLGPHPSRTGSSRYDDDGKRLPCPPPRDEDQVSDALYIACRADRLEVARFLLDHDADPNWRGYAGATCLAWAEFSGNAALCALLRERGGRDDLRDAQFDAVPRVFPLMVFAGWGFARKLAERLMADRSLVSVRGGKGTLLHAAAGSGQVDATRVLLALGGDRTALDPAGHTPLELAEAGGHRAVCDLLRLGNRS